MVMGGFDAQHPAGHLVVDPLPSDARGDQGALVSEPPGQQPLPPPMG